MREGWSCQIVSVGGDIDLRQLDDAGQEWHATGPRNVASGSLREALARAIDGPIDQAWLGAVVDAIERERDPARSALLVKRATGTWYHATSSANRRSIRRHGLDHRRMIVPGIAGSRTAEAAGVFLGCGLEDARFFARMGCRRGPVHIWAVTLTDVWLSGDPGGGGGGGDLWMICPDVIDPRRLRLQAGRDPCGDVRWWVAPAGALSRR